MHITMEWRKLSIAVVTTSLCILAHQLNGVDAAYWGDVQMDDCILPGYRKYYARLWDIDGDWMEACRNELIYIHARYYSSPNNCVDKGFLGIWGEWYVQDSSCNRHLGTFRDNGCQTNGCRKFSSVLWDIPRGVSWEDWCSRSWADIGGQHFDTPSACVNNYGLNMWGEFDFDDRRCGSCYPRASPKQLDAAPHGGLAGDLSPSNPPSSSPPSDSSSGTPWNQ